MKLPKDIPFVILDQNMYGTQESSRLTEDFIEWLVRDCAKVCAEEAKAQHTNGMDALLKKQPNVARLHAAGCDVAERCVKNILTRYELEQK